MHVLEGFDTGLGCAATRREAVPCASATRHAAISQCRTPTAGDRQHKGRGGTLLSLTISLLADLRSAAESTLAHLRDGLPRHAEQGIAHLADLHQQAADHKPRAWKLERAAYEACSNQVAA